MASIPQRADLDMGSASLIINLNDPTLAQHAATKAYVDSAVEGLSWKDSVRVRAVVQVALAAPGANIDGIAMVAGDRWLATAQTAQTENGIYVWTGAATPATRALDMNTAPEVEQAVTTVEEGTSAGSTFRQTAVNVTLGTTALAWTSFGTGAPAATETTSGIAEIATQAETDAGTDDARFVTPLKLATYSGRIKKTAVTFGDGAATSYVIPHISNTLDVEIYVYEVGGLKREVFCEKQHTSVGTITVLFPTAVALNSLRCVVVG